MPVVLAPTRKDIQKALVAFLAAVAPGLLVIQGQQNRMPEPDAPDYLVFWPMRQPPISTPLDTTQFARFTAAIAGNVLTVSAMAFGVVPVGGGVFGNGLDPATVINSQITGAPGGIGNYALGGPSQSVSSEAMTASDLIKQSNNEWVFQLDVHGPSSSDNATKISASMRGEFPVTVMQAVNPLVAPLYADEPRFAPFLNAEQQYEDRWIVEAHLQANQTVSGLPQDTAAIVAVTPISVDVAYPP